MSKRLAVLAATTALVGLSHPAMAQQGWVDGSYDTVAETAMRGGHAWSDEPQAGVSWDPVATTADETADAYVSADEDYDYAYGSREVVQTDRSSHGSRGHHRGHNRDQNRGGHHAAPSSAPRLAYGAAERAEWLAQCRSLHAQPDYADYYEDERRGRGNGGLIGGLIGAVTGGFAGNRIADGDRLLGTVIGAGVGGLAGAVIGSVVDGARDRDDDRDDSRDRRRVYSGGDHGFDYCEAYLLNYERGYGVPGQVAYAPVMMVPVAQQAHGQSAQHRRTYRVIEEDVVVESRETHAPQRRIRRAAPAREQGKLLSAD